MLSDFAKSTAPWVLALALTFLAGVLPAANSLAAAGESRVDLCCRHAAEEPVQASDNECSDPGCHGSAWGDWLLFHNAPPRPLQSLPHSHQAWSAFVPAVPGRTIDYPPEIS